MLDTHILIYLLKNRPVSVAERVNALAPETQLCMSFVTYYLKNAGTPIGANDLWIACHALAIEAVLVTHNTREFARVPGLQWEDWVVD